MDNINIKEEQFKLQERKIKNFSNKFLYGFIAIFIIGYAVFFTSTLWLPNTYKGVETTPIGETVSLENKNVTIDSWTFSKDQRKMEIVMEVQNLDLVELESYDFVVKTVKGALDTKVIMQKDDFYVIHADNVPKNWTEASVTITAKSEGTSDEEESSSPITLYTNNKIVSSVNDIRKLDLLSYQKIAYTTHIKMDKKAISELEDKITHLDKQIAEGESKVAAMEADIDNQTESEAVETINTIDSLKQQIDSLKTQKTEMKDEITEKKEKIEIYNRLLEEGDSNAQQTYHHETNSRP